MRPSQRRQQVLLGLALGYLRPLYGVVDSGLCVAPASLTVTAVSKAHSKGYGPSTLNKNTML